MSHSKGYRHRKDNTVSHRSVVNTAPTAYNPHREIQVSEDYWALRADTVVDNDNDYHSDDELDRRDAIRAQLLQATHRVIEALPAKKKDIITLWLSGNHTIAEIAQIHEQSPQSIQQILWGRSKGSKAIKTKDFFCFDGQTVEAPQGLIEQIRAQLLQDTAVIALLQQLRRQSE
jgi:DNA-directed RNA polymerase specialized sigma24 family protein